MKPEHMEGYKRKLRWQTIVILAFMFVLFAGAGFQRFMLWNDTGTHPAPGIVIQNPAPSDFDFDENEYTFGTEIHAFAAGERESHTQSSILLLGGWSTANPVMEYIPLIEHLRKTARVIAIERPGYGWSGGKYSERTLDNMLIETRGTLEHLGETGPYIIVAHTTAGLEAIHFANEYPYEVAGIVFLNALAPSAYAYRLDSALDYIRSYSYQVPKHTGIFRAITLFAPQLFTPKAADIDVGRYAAMYCKNVMSPAMLAERAKLSQNVKTARAGGVPYVPAKAFVDEKGYYANPELNRAWSEFNQSIGAEVFEVEKASGIHITDPRMLAREILKMLS
jgi:pimeloyl-ACP methyl ester carboxylesterase